MSFQNKVLVIALCLSIIQHADAMKRECEDSSYESGEVKISAHNTRYGKAVEVMTLDAKIQALQLSSFFPVNTLTPEEVCERFKKGANVLEVDENGLTPLHACVNWRRRDAIVSLLMHGASVIHYDNQHNTVLHAAASTTDVIVDCLLVSPQGGPVTSEGLHDWKQALATTSIVLRRLSVVKDMRLKICKLLLLKPEELVAQTPIRHLAYFSKFYGDIDKIKIVELLVERHIKDITYALRARNRQGNTPYVEARNYVHNRMTIMPPPIESLNLDNLGKHTGLIAANYKSLIDKSE